MNRIELPAGEWVEIATAVESLNFNLMEYPKTTQNSTYLVASGLAEPSDNTESVVIEMTQSTQTVSFSNSVAQNVYVKSLYEDGYVLI